jgi:outer membrane protein, multidrug efflux system
MTVLSIIRTKNHWHPAHLCGACIAIAVTLIFSILSGCAAVGPDFKRPEASVPAQWNGPLKSGAVASQTAVDEELSHWWTSFNDPVLTSLEERAASSNLNLKLAEARIRQARASRIIAAGGQYPAVDATGLYRRSGTPVTGLNGTTTNLVNNQYQLGFDASWEADIFGGVRRNVEAADADLQTEVESRRDVLVTLMAEVASSYIQLRQYQQQLAVTNENLESQKNTARLTHIRFEGGFASGLDVANAEAQTATTTAQVPQLESLVQQSIYSISILLGEAPATLNAELSPTGAIPNAPPSVPAGVPSDLLLRRPDIRMAETAIHAATARIGAAESDLYPKFTISGALGLESSKSSTLLEWANRFWSLSAGALWHLFAGGQLQAGVDVQKAIQEQQLITYQQTVLTALQEVENALIASDKEQTRREDLITAVAANRKAVSLAVTMYTDGLTDFTNVLLSQQALYSTENALVQSSAALSTNLVALYKALGGGWAPESPGEATPQTVSAK